MTSAQAKQIASNYMRQQSDYVFSAVTVKSLAPANGPVKVWLTTEDDYGDELIVEVEMNPQSNEIRWKKICFIFSIRWSFEHIPMGCFAVSPVQI